MTRASEVVRLARWIANGLDRASPLGGRDSGPRRPMIHRHRVIRAQRRGVRLDHRMQAKPLADLRQDRHAELAAAVGDHEIHRFGGRLFGGANEVAFVLPVLGVYDDDRPTFANRVDGLFDAGKVMFQAGAFHLFRMAWFNESRTSRVPSSSRPTARWSMPATNRTLLVSR